MTGAEGSWVIEGEGMRGGMGAMESGTHVGHTKSPGRRLHREMFVPQRAYFE